jgi:hypothetical protein
MYLKLNQQVYLGSGDNLDGKNKMRKDRVEGIIECILETVSDVKRLKLRLIGTMGAYRMGTEIDPLHSLSYLLREMTSRLYF